MIVVLRSCPVDNHSIFYLILRFSEREKMTEYEGAGGLLPASTEKLLSDLCTVELTILILIKNLSLHEELWSCSLEYSWQRMNEIVNIKINYNINKRRAHKSI